ncbi:DUF397 domain-containing protein [Streptomyces sporangiiformans]|uniref:DUF397 domain-containing protein n=1 Tax=Streptomyces sporangiiformans TaxID=2315329 RepID=A0A505DDN8_9ACTN|nr:DUF397 domain-containing protein [Streptomyces sporangiiformans]TPQ15859.1 DUF397 domain-containing protein [Streptomyces sporangiiformans]
MREYDLSSAQWRKSTYSDGNGGDCIEVADGVPNIVPVRDSKVPDGPVLVFPADAWAAFVGASVAHPSGPWRDGSGAC